MRTIAINDTYEGVTTTLVQTSGVLNLGALSDNFGDIAALAAALNAALIALGLSGILLQSINDNPAGVGQQDGNHFEIFLGCNDANNCDPDAILDAVLAYLKMTITATTVTASTTTITFTYTATDTSTATITSTLPAVTTLLNTAVAAGATTIAVADQAGFTIGSTIAINGGGNSETNTITGFGSIQLANPLQHSYPAGSIVSQLPALDTWSQDVKCSVTGNILETSDRNSPLYPQEERAAACMEACKTQSDARCCRINYDWTPARCHYGTAAPTDESTAGGRHWAFEVQAPASTTAPAPDPTAAATTAAATPLTSSVRVEFACAIACCILSLTDHCVPPQKA